MSGKTATQMRADLRTDLKDSGSLWSDAELNRAVEKAVSDLTRFVPRELIYELSLQFDVTDEDVDLPESTDVDQVVDNESLNGKVSGNTCTIDGQPDVPRPLTVTITDADLSITGLVIIISGYNADGQGITETLTYSVGQATTLYGKLYFDYVTSVELDQVGGTPGVADVIEVGVGALSGVWLDLANKPVKYQSESFESTDGATAYARNVDYYIDYANGRVKAVSGGSLAASTQYHISYTKDQLSIDLSDLADFIRVDKIEYPVGDVPQTNASANLYGNVLTVVGKGEADEQEEMSEDYHIRVYYHAAHKVPSDYAPGTVPEFLENTVLMAAGAYALFQYALKQEHQAATDLASARTAYAAAQTAHTLLDTALTNVKKYLDNNSSADAVGLLTAITTQAADLRTAIETAVDKMKTDLDKVSVDTTGDIALAKTPADLIDDYATGSTAPAAKKYLEDGDAFLNTVNVGGEQQEVPLAYAKFAEMSLGISNALIAQAGVYQQSGTLRVNSVMGYMQEAAQRLSNLRSYIEQSAGYTSIAATFAREAEARLVKISADIQEGNGYIEAAEYEMLLADKFKAEAVERRDEVWTIWRDKGQWIGDRSTASNRQMAQY